jgi:hypothetical protein
MGYMEKFYFKHRNTFSSLIQEEKNFTRSAKVLSKDGRPMLIASCGSLYNSSMCLTLLLTEHCLLSRSDYKNSKNNKHYKTIKIG